MKRKGFTLIELLAVIVVLAIVIIIATPMILNVIDNVKKEAVKTSANNYISSVEQYIVSSELRKTQKLKSNTIYNLTESTLVDGVSVPALNDLVDISKSKPTGMDDYILLDDKNQVKEGKINIDSYKIEIEDYNIKSIVKGKKIDVESIALNIEDSVMERGSEMTLSVSFNPENASVQTVNYKSSDTDIVTVDEKGKIKGIKNGEATITATSKDNEEAKAEVKITVISPSDVTGLRIEKENEESKLYRGNELQLVGVLEPSDATSNALTWESSDESIATVTDSGEVTGIALGDVTIKAISQSGIEATIDLTVEEPPYTGITSKDYTVGETVSYAGKTWKVIKDNGNSTTMVLSSNYTTGAFGSTTEFIAGNNAYDKVNTDFVNATALLKSDIELGGIKLDSDSNSYVRLPLYSELSSKISNGSSTTFWTMTPYNSSNMYYATSAGGTSYTSYSGYGSYTRYYDYGSSIKSLTYKSSCSSSTKTTYISPTSTYGLVNGSYARDYSSSSYTTIVGSDFSTLSSSSRTSSINYCEDSIGVQTLYYNPSGSTTYYAASSSGCSSSYYYSCSSSGTSNMGIRPVITVREK